MKPLARMTVPECPTCHGVDCHDRDGRMHYHSPAAASQRWKCQRCGCRFVTHYRVDPTIVGVIEQGTLPEATDGDRHQAAAE